ncbi:MAG: polymer-forming cytoskeletal protein [Firmicutes bacterium]|nr:polymer-forming cytoskeletal protein [Bacillota bacterium]
MFGRKKEPEAPVKEVAEKIEAVVEEKPAEPPKPAFVPAPATRIGEGITMVGNFDTKDPVEIRGIVRGNIKSSSSVSIAKNGALIGEAALDSMKVEGRIDGTVLCAQDAVFTSTGSMKGNLSTGTLRTDAGSNFEGKLNMIPKKPAAKPAAPAEAPAANAAPAAAAQVRRDADPVYETLADAIRAKEAAQKATQN